MARKAAKKSRRKLYLYASVLGGLTITSMVLRVFGPQPLTPDAAATLFAVDSPQSMDAIFDTHTPATQTDWRYIYIHHTATPGGNALTLGEAGSGLGDHFLIGNGDGCIDGQIQIGQRWIQQKAAVAPAGVTRLEESCISICVVGNFDYTLPTATQLRRVTQLVTALQSRLRIPGNRVIMVDKSQGPAGIGGRFPTSQLRAQFLP